MPKVFFFSTPAVSVLKILTGPSDKPDYSVQCFCLCFASECEIFCVLCLCLYGKLYVVVPFKVIIEKYRGGRSL